VGVAAAAAGGPLLARLVPSTLPVAEHASLDLRVLAIAFVFVLLTGIAFGLAPAMRAGRSSALDLLRSGTRTAGGRTQRLRAALVVVEVAASVVLLVMSGLLIRAVWRIQTTDPGFVADGVLTLETALPLPKYEATERRAQFYERVLQEVRALPGVRDAAYATGLPMAMRGGIWTVSFHGAVRHYFDDSKSYWGLRYGYGASREEINNANDLEIATLSSHSVGADLDVALGSMSVGLNAAFHHGERADRSPLSNWSFGASSALRF